MNIKDIYICTSYAKSILKNNLKDEVLEMVNIFLYNENIFHRFGDGCCRVLFGFEIPSFEDTPAYGTVPLNMSDSRIPYSGNGYIYMSEYFGVMYGEIVYQVCMSMFNKDMSIYLTFTKKGAQNKYIAPIYNLLNKDNLG